MSSLFIINSIVIVIFNRSFGRIFCWFVVISVVISTSFFLGIFLVLIFYTISSNLKFLYLDIKNNYTKDDKYLAVITANGLWIKDHISENINYINAKNIPVDRTYRIIALAASVLMSLSLFEAAATGSRGLSIQM